MCISYFQNISRPNFTTVSLFVILWLLIGTYALQSNDGAENDKTEQMAKSAAQKNHTIDEEIYNDDDFYHQLLRELIEQKTNRSDDPIAMSR